jgi:hypothetical protein
MPNRIIKESICSSEKLAALSDFEFRLWVGLITQADDAGRGDARPAIIKGHIFPFRERLSIKDIDAALQELAAKGCVSLYKVDGKPYFLFPGWVKHQRVRDCKPKFPEPPENGALDTFAADCGELPQVAADCGYNPIQSESESNPNPKEGVRAARFTPPTVDEVRDYCRERGNSVDAERFVDFYTAKGWKVGKSPMKDWKAAVRTWEKEDGDGKRRSQPRGVDREEAQRSDSKWGITYST